MSDETTSDDICTVREPDPPQSINVTVILGVMAEKIKTQETRIAELEAKIEESDVDDIEKQRKLLEIKCRQKDERIAALEDTLRTTRAIVTEGAKVGFNPLEGDWATPLFRNQAAITALIGITVKED
jgi:hypothetical protein